jgi:hypothetical protein
MKMISEHISDAEYRCGCGKCAGLPPSWTGVNHPDVYNQFFMDWEEIREEWGQPLIINSGFRCPAHNKAIGGEPLSAHLWGLALDYAPEDPSKLSALYKVALDLHPEFRIGIYRTQKFIHCDVAYEISPIVVKEWKYSARWQQK